MTPKEKTINSYTSASQEAKWIRIAVWKIYSNYKKLGPCDLFCLYAISVQLVREEINCKLEKAKKQKAEKTKVIHLVIYHEQKRWGEENLSAKIK